MANEKISQLPVTTTSSGADLYPIVQNSINKSISFTDLQNSLLGGASVVTSLNSLSGALNLVPGSGIMITPSGSNITISTTGVSGANQSLSNLTNPTAINQNLLFGSNTLVI